MQYTLRNVPEEVDRCLRERARAWGVSLNEATLKVLAQATNVAPPDPQDVAAKERAAAFEEMFGCWAGEAWVEDYVQFLAESDAASPEIDTA